MSQIVRVIIAITSWIQRPFYGPSSGELRAVCHENTQRRKHKHKYRNTELTHRNIQDNI